MSFKDYSPNKVSNNSIDKLNDKSIAKIKDIKYNLNKSCANQKVKIDQKKSKSNINKRFKFEKSKRKNTLSSKENPREIQKFKYCPRSRYRTKPLEINLGKYVKPVVDKWFKDIKKNQKQLQLNKGKRFISKKENNFTNVYSKRGLYNYAGVVYRIIEKGTGKIRYGSTQGTLEGRWNWYKMDALRNINNPSITSFHREILKSMKIGKDVDNNYIMRPVDVCFDINTLALREYYWIDKHNTQDPSKGYNIKGGGVGIRLDVPMSKIAKGIAYGLSINDIKILLSNSTGMNFSRKTISRRIKQYWGGKEEARKRFLKPVLEGIIKDGYKTNDIIHTFNIYGRNIVERIIPQMFSKKSFSDVRRDYLKKLLVKYITMGLGPKAIDKNLKFHGLTEIQNTIKEEWGSLDLAQKKLWKPIFITRLREGDHPSKILLEFGYSENSAKSQYNRVLKRLFNGMTYNQIKEKIKNKRN